jgi:hypothetical protein
VLESILGVRLLLWTGNPVPTPSPSLLEPLRRAEVHNDAEAGDGFQLTFALTRDAFGRYDVVDTLAPGTRVWIGAVLGVVPEPLVDGVVERHDLSPGDHPGETTLTVTGTTVTSLLGLEEKNTAFANQPDYVIVARTLASYPELGLVPDVTPTTDVPIELQRTPQQRETDLALINRLAAANSFVFYSEPITFGVNRAHWGPVVRAGVPQRALTRGMGSHGNCSRLSFSNDSLAPEGATGTFVEPITKMRIPIPALPALRLPPLSASPSTARRTTVLRDTANAGPIQTALASAAAATRSPEAVTGQGTVETARYGGILRARGLVGVRGAGLDYDGFYYVTRVTHSIARGSYTQSFGLSREGTGTLTPVVVP